MPYVRKYRIKRPYRKRGMRKTLNRMPVRSVARKAYTGVRYLKGLVNSEMFKHDFSYGITSIGGSGTVVPICGIAQGDGVGGRTGLSILARFVSLQGIIQWSGTGYQHVTMLVVQDNQQVYDAPSPIIAGGDQGVLTSYSPWSHLNPANVGRFSVLARKTFSVSIQYPVKNFSFKLPLMHHVRYNGANVNDISKGGLSLIFVQDSGVTDPASFTLNGRLHYRDN